MFTYAMKETEITRTTPSLAYNLLNIEIYMLIYKKGASWNSFFFFNYDYLTIIYYFIFYRICFSDVSHNWFDTWKNQKIPSFTFFAKMSLEF